MILPNSPARVPSWFKRSRSLREKHTKAIILFLISVALFCAGYYSKHSIDSAESALYGYLPNATAPLSASSSSEDNRAEIWSSFATKPQVGKVHAVFGEPNPTYERALDLHRKHSLRMGHPMFILRERILSGLWSKPAYILQIILQELSRPEEERLKWLLWADADVIIMNSYIPLDIFIPPQPEFEYVNMLVSNDGNGLNNGIFLIRVNDWAVKLLSGIISFHHFKPDVKLKFSEQSGMEEMIEQKYWRKAIVHVPQFWFNAYATLKKPNEPDSIPAPKEFRAGGLLIHFAGNKDGLRPDRMNSAMDLSDQELPELSMPVEKTWYPGNITAFWEDLSAKRTAKGIPKFGSEEAPVAKTGTAEPGTTSINNVSLEKQKVVDKLPNE